MADKDVVIRISAQNLTQKEFDAARKQLDALGKNAGLANKDVGQLGKGFGDLIQKTTGLTPAMFGVAGGIAAAGLGIIKATKDTVELGSQLIDLRAKTGISVEALQELKFAAEQTGVSFDAITRAILLLGARVADPTKEVARTVDALGLSLGNLLALSPEERFLKVGDAIAKIQNPAQQAAAAMDLFGKSGTEILPTLNAGLVESIERFRELGATMSTETAEAADQLGDELDELNARWVGIKTAIGSVAIPALLQFLDGVQSIIAIIKLGFVDALKNFAETMDLLALAPGAVGESFTALADSARDLAADLDKSARKALVDVVTETEKVPKSAGAAGFAMLDFGDKSEKASKQFKRASDETAVLTQGMKQLEDIRHFETIQRTAEAYAQEQREIAAATAALEPHLQAAREHLATLDATVPKIVPIELETRDWGETQDVVNDALSEARGLFDLLGVSADSTLGKILGWATKIFDMFNGITGLISKVMGLFGGGGGGLGGIFGGLGSLLGGGAGAAAGVVPIGVPGAITGATAAAGGGLGGLGGALAGFFTNPFTIGIGAAIGVGFLIDKLFGGKSNFEKTGEELGMEVGRNVQFGIVNLFEQRGGTIGEAIQLSLGEVIKDQVAQGVANFDELTAKTADFFSFFERGDITATETQKGLNEAVAQLLPHLGELGAAGVAQLERLIGAAEHFGITFEGIDEVAAFLGQSVADSAAQAEQSLNSASGAAKNFRDILADIGGGDGRVIRDDFPITGAQHGFHGDVTGPRGFFIERGVRERVDIGPSGGGGGAQTIINIDARGAQHGVADEIAAALANVIGRGRNPGGIDVAIRRVANGG